jgi:hypothetical protein
MPLTFRKYGIWRDAICIAIWLAISACALVVGWYAGYWFGGYLDAVNLPLQGLH